MLNIELGALVVFGPLLLAFVVLIAIDMLDRRSTARDPINAPVANPLERADFRRAHRRRRV